ncbi:hypothetical protein [Lonsdalea iberica]|uniref:hypothetical protein n=1 Tax=Lonsdalea iberica TaxID=1082703 RepID=UPI00111C02DD|nr:hypothetical protein [Lonsdalea iberica]
MAQSEVTPLKLVQANALEFTSQTQTSGTHKKHNRIKMNKNNNKMTISQKKFCCFWRFFNNENQPPLLENMRLIKTTPLKPPIQSTAIK